jgi:predicted DCC family thiol-disulfide oxidoreductase YuxK
LLQQDVTRFSGLVIVLKLFRYHKPTDSAKPPGVHVLIFDGSCGFCRTSAEFIHKHARSDVTLVPFSELSQYDFLTSLNQCQILASAHYITPHGKEYHGGESITRALRLLPGCRVVCLLDLWGIDFFRELVYTLVASNRSILSKLIGLPQAILKFFQNRSR